MAKKRKQNISASERARRRRQALINFGYSQKSNSTKRGANKVARKRRSKTRRFYGNGGLKPTAVLIGGGAYGAVRSKVSDLLAPVTSRIPLGSIADEVGMFALAYLAHKKGGKMLKNVAMAGMAVEAARMGEALISGSAFSSGGASVSNTFATIA